MALSAATTWEVRTAGSDTACSGGFVTGASGADYSQQNAAQYTGTNLVIDGATNTKVTSATHNFVAADVGNLMQITAGSGFTTGFFEIVSVASNAATLDRSAGTLGSTAGTFAVGGALATPGLAVANMVAANTIYAKGGYTTTTNTANVAGGRLNFLTTGTHQAVCRFIGYTTTRTDGGRYVITLGATFTAPAITTNSANPWNDIRNVEVAACATASASAILLDGRQNRIVNLKVGAFTGGTPNGNGMVSVVGVKNNAFLKDFEISGGATDNYVALNMDANGQSVVMDGWVHGNAGVGMNIQPGGSPMIARVISADHTGANGFGWQFQGTGGETTLFECGAWNNAGGDYYLLNADVSLNCIRCVSGGGGGNNWNSFFGSQSLNLWYCASKANTSGLYGGVTLNTNVGMVTLTGDPWVDRANGNFAPDNTASEGAALRGVAETIFGLTTTYADVGPAQHQDAGGGAGGTGPSVIVSSGAGSRGGSW